MVALLKQLSRRLVLLVCWLIILSAVVLSLARLLTPLLNQHREQFANLASKVLEHPVTIEALAASWYHFEPVLKFRNVTAYDKPTHQPLLKCQLRAKFVQQICSTI